MREVAGLHTAHLEPFSGFGFLVAPPLASDTWLSGPLLGADWDSAMRALSSMGWQPLTDEDGCLIVEGVTESGERVFAIGADCPIVGQPDLTELVAAREALVSSVGLRGS